MARLAWSEATLDRIPVDDIRTPNGWFEHLFREESTLVVELGARAYRALWKGGVPMPPLPRGRARGFCD